MIHAVNLAPAESVGYLVSLDATAQADPWRPYDWAGYKPKGDEEIGNQYDGWVTLAPGEAAWVMILKRIKQPGYRPGPMQLSLDVFDRAHEGDALAPQTWDLRLTGGSWVGDRHVEVDRAESDFSLAIRNSTDQTRTYEVNSTAVGPFGGRSYRPSKDLIRAVSGFECVRQMELVAPQFVRRADSETSPWGADDRIEPCFRWPETGPSIRQAAALTYRAAMAAGAGQVWLNLPIDSASTVGAIQLALDQVAGGRESADAPLGGLVTWGNELFNWIFPQTRRLANLIAPDTEDQTMAIADWYADRLVALWQALDGRSLDLRVVAEWTVAQPFYLERILERCSETTGGLFVPDLAVNCYFGDGEQADRVSSRAELDYFLGEELDALDRQLSEAAAIAYRYGVALHAYEGNHHLWSSEHKPKSEVTVAVFREAIADRVWLSTWLGRLAATAERNGVEIFSWHTAARPLIDLPGGPGFPPTFIAFAAEFFPGDPASPVRALLAPPPAVEEPEEPPTIDGPPKTDVDAIKALAISGLVSAIEERPEVGAKLLGIAAALEALEGDPETVAMLRGFAAYADAIQGKPAASFGSEESVS